MNREEAINIFRGLVSIAKTNTNPTMSVCNVKNEVFIEVYQGLLSPQPDPITGLVPCGCKYCDSTHGQRYLFRENKNAPYRGMISTVEITEDDCKKYSQIEGNLYDENGNNFYFVFDIRHCPMCGRELQVAL